LKSTENKIRALIKEINEIIPMILIATAVFLLIIFAIVYIKRKSAKDTLPANAIITKVTDGIRFDYSVDFECNLNSKYYSGKSFISIKEDNEIRNTLVFLYKKNDTQNAEI
jgi:hypothetical protein